MDCIANVDPPSGTVIADFEGTLNITTLTCNVTTSGGTLIPTSWFVNNFRGVSRLQTILEGFAPELFSISGEPLSNFPMTSSRNQLTILNLTLKLDGVIVYCGSGAEPQAANFILRVYRKYAS